MSGRMTIAMVAALMGCASLHPAGDLAAGRWNGAIDSAGWLQAFSLEIDNDSGIHRGAWRSALGLRSEPLQNLEVEGDAVRFETEKLLFTGHVQGRKLSGTVSRKGADVPDAEFSVTHDDPRFHPDEEQAFGQMH